MDDLLKLLAVMEKKPALYIGNTDLSYLSQFLSGYCFAKTIRNLPPTAEDIEESNKFGKWLYNDFRIFLAEKYNDTRSYNWARLIIENEKDGNSTDTFFRLLHEYLIDHIV